MNAVDTAVFGELTHHQPVFTTADVIKTTGGSPVWATQSLSALAKEGLIAKVRRGLWALPGHADFSPYAIIPQLLRATKGEKTDVRGYVSLLSALNLHGMIDQAPHVIQIVAERIRPSIRRAVFIDPARPLAATFPRAEVASELLSPRITRVDRKDRR